MYNTSLVLRLSPRLNKKQKWRGRTLESHDTIMWPCDKLTWTATILLLKSELQHSLVRPQHDSNSSDSREVSSFLDFSPQVLLISVPARTRVQFEGGVNITQQCIPSKVLAHVRSVRREVLIATSNEHNCLNRDLCCSVSCHPSRLYSTRPSSVPWCEWLLHLEPHPPHVNFIIVRALVEGGINFA